MSENTELIQFTDEAKSVLFKYISDLEESFNDMDMTQDEIDKSIDDIKQHLISYCIHISSGEVVSTDLVRKGINKLGDPEIIRSTLDNEFELMREIQSDTIDPSKKVSSQQVLEITAKHLVVSYLFFSWLFTTLVLFELFQFNTGIILPISLIIPIVIMSVTHNSKQFPFNNYLNDNLQPNVHLVLMPLFIILWQIIQSQFDFTTPIVIVSWLFMIFSKPGINYLENIWDNMVEFRKQYL